MKNKVKTLKSVYLTILLVLVLCASFVLCSCSSTDEDLSKYDIVLENTSLEMEKGTSLDLVYSLTKDGVVDSTLTATVEVEGDAVTYDEATKKLTAVKSGEATVKITCKKGEGVTKSITVTVPEYTISFTSTTLLLEEGQTKDIPYVVKKDGATVNGKKVTITAEGDAIKVNSVKKEVTALKPGNAKVIVKLEDDQTVQATLNVVISAVFFSRSEQLKRGELDFSHEKDGQVGILGGQATVLCVQDDMKFVFKGTLTIASALNENQSVGIGAFLDNGNNAIWFAVRGNAQGSSDLYIRNFLNGWNEPSFDNTLVKNHNFGNTIEYTIVRSGDEYYYSVGGIKGYFLNTLSQVSEEPLYPGFFSQEKAATLTNYSVAYDNESVNAAINEIGSTVSLYHPINSFNSIDSENVVTMQFFNLGWATRDLPLATLYYEEELPSVFSLEFDVKFSQVQNDGKLAVRIGSYEFHINNKGNFAGQIYPGTWEGAPSGSTDKASNEWAKVCIQRSSSFVRLYIDGKLIAQKDGVAQGNRLDFYTFANNDNDALAEVSFKNLVVNGVFIDLSAPSPEIAQNLTMQLQASVYGSSDPVVWSLDTTSLTSGNAQISTDGLLQASFDAAGEVVVKATVGNCVVSKTIQVVGTPKIIHTYSKNVTYADENTFTMKMAKSAGNDGWDNSLTKATYKDTVPSTSFIMTFKLAFSEAMTDGKFCVQFDGEEKDITPRTFTICNGTGEKNKYKAEIRNKWGGAQVTDWNLSNIQVRIVAINGVAKMYINDTYEVPHSVVFDENSHIYFWDFNRIDGEYNVTATVSDIAFRTEFLTISGQNYVQQGKTAQINAVKYNSTNNVVWTIDPHYEGVSIDQNGLLTAEDDAAVGQVTVKATIGDFSNTFTVQVMEMIRCVTSNNSNLISANETGFVAKMSNSFWDFDNTKITYKDSVSSTNFIMTFNLAFSEAMTDGKFCVQFGDGNAFTICNGTGEKNKYKTEIREVWGGYTVTNWDISNINVRIEVINKIATLYINDDYICRKTVTVEVDSPIYFWHHNTETNTFETTATVTNLELITNFAKVIGPANAEKGKVTAYTANVYGEQNAATWEIDTTNLTGTASISTNGELTVDTAASGSIVVKAIVDGKAYSRVVSVIDETDAISTDKDCYSNITSDGFKLTTISNGWNLDGTKATYKEVVPAENFELSFNLALSKQMRDGKFCIQFGGNNDTMNLRTITICFGQLYVDDQFVANQYKTEVKDVWGGNVVTDWDISNISVKIRVIGLVAKIYINDNYVGHGEAGSNNERQINVGDNIYFWELSENANDIGVEMTVSNLKLTRI